jgi:DNA (cytosine-5)-methyltransferase 1
MRYGSVCSGIEAATVAWHSLGWVPSFFSEIEKFPREVLAHHYPDVPLHGDFTTIGENQYGSIDLLVGGTPCQSFSIAGLRKGLDDDRGNLALEFIKLAQRERPRWVVWENVPGVLSSNGGKDFGSFLGALGEIGYGFAYRVLDAQYFGVAQRRRRVFVVGYLGDWRRAAAVLFERESLRGNPAPSREKGEKPAPTVTSGPPFSRTGNDRVECDAYIPEVASTLQTTANDYSRADGFNAIATASSTVAYDMKQHHNPQPTDTFSLTAGNCNMVRGDTPLLQMSLQVRRLTPTECERLQGFPDGYTNIKDKCPDGPRYKALGNSMAVPVMRWIGERIQEVDKL